MTIIRNTYISKDRMKQDCRQEILEFKLISLFLFIVLILSFYISDSIAIKVLSVISVCTCFTVLFTSSYQFIRTSYKAVFNRDDSFRVILDYIKN